MIELFYKALRITSIGVIILDDKHNIIFFNYSIEKLCNIPEKKAIGKKIETVLPVFNCEQYKNMIDTVLSTGQSRFCSSAIHKSFVYSKGESRDLRRQNMKVEFLSSNNKSYVVIQIIDITDSHRNEINLQNRINQLKKGYEDLNFTKTVAERLAKYDALTGLLSRYYFELKFSDLAKEASLKGERMGIIFIDLDRFKEINDTHGHMVGDALLQLVASKIKNYLNHTDFAMRMGGDEFVIAMKNLYGNSYIEKSAEKLLKVLKKPYYIDNKIINITASIGVSIYPDHEKNLGELINKADKAMYFAKQNGKNMVQLYNNSL